MNVTVYGLNLNHKAGIMQHGIKYIADCLIRVRSCGRIRFHGQQPVAQNRIMAGVDGPEIRRAFWRRLPLQ
jgi:hypothetical protein